MSKTQWYWTLKKLIALFCVYSCMYVWIQACQGTRVEVRDRIAEDSSLLRL